MKRTDYQALIKTCEHLGAARSILKNITPYYTLKSEARLRYEIRKLKQGKAYSSVRQSLVPRTQLISAKRAESVVGLISEYPTELHEKYMERRKKFLTACSLKMQLNALSENQIQPALALQYKIWRLFQFVDRANEILLHYRETKGVLSVHPQTDFSRLSALQCVQRRNTLRSNLVSRKKTLEKLEKNLPAPGSTDYLRRWDLFQRKKEQYLELQQEIAQLTALIEN